MKNKIYKALTIFIALCSIVACVPLPKTIGTNATNTEAILIQTPSPLITKMMPSPTRTAIPTLTHDDAIAEISSLMSDNNGCSFPCFWGWTPGQTLVADVRNHLNSFSIFSVGTPNLQPKRGHIWLIMPWSQNSYLGITMEYRGKGELLELLMIKMQMMLRFTDANGNPRYEVSWGDSQLVEITKIYSLSQVLSEYAVPSEILVRTHQASLLNQPWPISLVVFYPEQGFMVEYVADGRPALNSSISWCSSLAFPHFWFWSPSSEIKISDVVAEIPGEQLDRESLASGGFKSIEEATGMSVDTFYSLFKSDGNMCVDTPINIWPMPSQ